MGRLSVAVIEGNSPNFRVTIDLNSIIWAFSKVRLIGPTVQPLPVQSGSRPTDYLGNIRFNLSGTNKLEVYTNSGWTEQGGSQTSAVDPVGTEGDGGGFTVADGADDTNANTYTDGGNFILHEGLRYNDGTTGDETMGATSNTRMFLEYVSSTNSADFAFHTGHGNPGSVAWPQYLCVKVTNYRFGKVLNRIRWYKHTNAVGNVDVFGSNQDIQRSNFTDESLYTHLGRLHFGGAGSGSEGGERSQTWTNSNGYRWYLVKMVDINSSALAYPQVGSQGGWAMYAMTFDKT